MLFFYLKKKKLIGNGYYKKVCYKLNIIYVYLY